MSKAYKCDQCGKYFDYASGNFRWDGEVCDKKQGFARYRVIVLVFNSGGPPTAEFMGESQPALGSKGNREFCKNCLPLIAKAALAKEKL